MSSTDTETELEALRYPVGQWGCPATLLASERRSAIAILRELPPKLRSAVGDLSPEQLDTPYRPGGWTVRQLVHHVADSHMNAYTRVRLALTEDWPTIKPYEEGLWAKLPDALQMPPTVSLDLLSALHLRWTELFGSLAEADWKRGYLHPENGRQSVEQVLSVYAWHSRHHLAHVTELRTRLHW
ncbi:MAG TPA: putative metal-dependent hydrolase [Acidobacteriaceae bacterium]